MAFDLWDGFVDARPAWGLRGPDCYGWPGDFEIVESADADDEEMGARLRRAEEMRSAQGTEPPVHHVAAIGNGAKIPWLAFDRHRIGWKNRIDGRAAGAEVLADPAPARSRRDRLRRDPVANRLA